MQISFVFILSVIAIIASLGVARLMATISSSKGWNANQAFWLPIGGYVLIVFWVNQTWAQGLIAPGWIWVILGLLSILGIGSVVINRRVMRFDKNLLSKSPTPDSTSLSTGAPLVGKISPLPDKPISRENDEPQSVRKKSNPRTTEKSGQIFISYRRSDSSDIAGRIYDRLIGKFGKKPIFKDVDSIPLGLDFKEYLGQKVGECDVLLAIIGDRWVDARDSTGKSRLHDPADFVSIEIQSALERGIPVIPLLVRDAQMPAEDVLPPSLQKLVFRNGIPIRSDPDFHRDMDRLIAALENYLHKER